MYKTRTIALAALALAAGCFTVEAHDHLAAGATSTSPGAQLVFANDATYGGDVGFVFNLEAGAADDPYFGYYYTSDLVFEALAATPDNGGPEPGAAALGTHIQVKLLSVEGPEGASFGFWETSADGVDSTNLTWSVPVPFRDGTNLINVTESDGSSTMITGSGLGSSGSARVSPIVISGMPATAMISPGPASAASCCSRFPETVKPGSAASCCARCRCRVESASALVPGAGFRLPVSCCSRSRMIV